MATLLQIPRRASSAASLAEELDRAPQVLPGGGTPEREPEPTPRRWNLESLAGGIAEISTPRAAGGLTAAARLILDAQEHGEPAAWIQAGDSLFYALDLHDGGVDLEALPIVRVAGILAGARAAEHLLRSGAFGLIVFDLGCSAETIRGVGNGPSCPTGSTRSTESSPTRPVGHPWVTDVHGHRRSVYKKQTCLPAAAQVRLAALCRRHQSALLLLARRPEGTPPLASLAVLRAAGTAHKTAFDRFTFRLEVLKDKRQGGGWSHQEICHGPDGLC